MSSDAISVFIRTTEEYQRTLFRQDLDELSETIQADLRHLLERCKTSVGDLQSSFYNDDAFGGAISRQTLPPTPRMLGDWLGQVLIRKEMKNFDWFILDRLVEEVAYQLPPGARMELYGFGGTDVMIDSFERQVWPYERGQISAPFRVLRALSQINEEQWVGEIARHIVASYRRRMRTLQQAGCWILVTSDPAWDSAIGPDEAKSVAAFEEYEERLDRLRSAWAKLSQEEQDILKAWRVDKQQVTEIASTRGWSLAKTYRRLEKASNRARELAGITRANV